MLIDYIRKISVILFDVIILYSLICISSPIYYLIVSRNNLKHAKCNIIKFVNHIPLKIQRIKTQTFKIIFYLISISLVAIYILGFIITLGFSTQIGSIFESQEYIGTYYVMISRDGTTYYKVPATILHNDSMREEHKLKTSYFIETVYWDNGGSLNFGNAYDYEFSQIFLDKSSIYYDQDGNPWEGKLTNEQAYSDHSIHLSSFDFVVCAIFIIGLLFISLLFIPMHLCEKQNTDENLN